MEQSNSSTRYIRAPRALIAPAIFAALVLAMFADVLFALGDVLGHSSTDLALQFLPWRQFGFDELRRGNLALWNPHIFGGAPYFAGFQSALLYPPNWLHLILPLGVAINWIIALHVFLAGYFTYLWLRARGASIPASILAGAMFMFGGPYFLHIYAGHLPHLAAMSWAPLIVLSIDMLHRSGAMRWCLLGAAGVAMQIYAGHPQYVYYTAIALTVYLALLLIQARHRASLIAGFTLIYLGGALLAAIQLLPGIEAANETVRSGGTGYTFASTLALPPTNLITLVAPNFFGRLSLAESISATSDAYWGSGYLWEMSLFVGGVGFVLALIGALRSRGSARWSLVAMIGITLVLALGRYTPLYRPMLALVPRYDSFRVTAKFGYLAVMFIAALSAAGFDQLVQRGALKRSGMIAVAAGALALVMLGMGIRISADAWPNFVHWIGQRASMAGELFQRDVASYSDPEFVKATSSLAARSSFIAAGTIGLMGVILVAMRRERRAAYGLVALGIIELFVFARFTRATLPLTDGFPPPQSAAERECFDAWRAALATLPADQRALNLSTELANSSMRLGYNDVWGYDPLVQRRYAELLAATQGVPPDRASQYLNVVRMPQIVFRMLRCGLVLSMDERRPTIRLEDPLPVVLVVPAFEVQTTRDAALVRLLNNGFDPARTITLESSPPFASDAAESAGSAEVVSIDTDAMEIRATLSRPAVLLVTNSYSAGWRARSANPDATQMSYEVVPANWALQGIALQPGSHHLMLEYAPRSFRMGKWLTIATLLTYTSLLVLYLFMSRRRRFR